MKRILCQTMIITLLFLLSKVSSFSQDKLINLLEGELKREMNSLSKQENPPYYISYRVSDIQSSMIVAAFGNITDSDKSRSRILSVAVRVGSYDRDNTHEIRGGQFEFLENMPSPVQLPLEDNDDAIRQAIWNATNKEYTEASDKYAKVKANIAVKVQEEDTSADFSKINNVVEYIEPVINPENYKFEMEIWKERLKKISAVFLNDNNIYQGSAWIRFKIQRKYFISSEGTKTAENYITAILMLNASIKSDDGMTLPLYRSYFAYKPEELPPFEQIMKDANDMVTKLKALRIAPVVDPYSGPAILSARASGVFFHEIFGHRIEGHRQKSENEGQTFKKKIGELILPASMTIYFDPAVKKYKGFDLNGYYKYDDEGVQGSKVVIIDKGVMKDFLMSRNPISKFYNSNGHGRAQEGYQAVSRQSNLILESSNPLTREQLRKKLIDECKKQNKEFGYYFEDITGGFTMTGRTIPNAFNVMPTEVYRIYVDGRPDELVRGVDLVGTPLAMFSQISDCGDNYGVFNGTCGAESGGVSVSAVTPAIFVKQIEVQKKSKSQDKPPILPRPGTEKGTP